MPNTVLASVGNSQENWRRWNLARHAGFARAGAEGMMTSTTPEGAAVRFLCRTVLNDPEIPRKSVHA